jgi:hypothetical protein
MRRNYLEGRAGDRFNAVLAAGYNFSLLLRWFEEFLRVLYSSFVAAVRPDSCLASLALETFFTGDLFSCVDLEKRVRSDHPLRAIRGLVNEPLAAVGLVFDCRRPSIAAARRFRRILLCLVGPWH